MRSAPRDGTEVEVCYVVGSLIGMNTVATWEMIGKARFDAAREAWLATDIIGSHVVQPRGWRRPTAG